MERDFDREDPGKETGQTVLEGEEDKSVSSKCVEGVASVIAGGLETRSP